jgi:hypothetical protein
MAAAEIQKQVLVPKSAEADTEHNSSTLQQLRQVHNAYHDHLLHTFTSFSQAGNFMSLFEQVQSLGWYSSLAD